MARTKNSTPVQKHGSFEEQARSKNNGPLRTLLGGAPTAMRRITELNPGRSQRMGARMRQLLRLLGTVRS
eukprot:13946960-Alexandrium_andersonii.AAC.1